MTMTGPRRGEYAKAKNLNLMAKRYEYIGPLSLKENIMLTVRSEKSRIRYFSNIYGMACGLYAHGLWKQWYASWNGYKKEMSK